MIGPGSTPPPISNTKIGAKINIGIGGSQRARQRRFAMELNANLGMLASWRMNDTRERPVKEGTRGVNFMARMGAGWRRGPTARAPSRHLIGQARRVMRAMCLCLFGTQNRCRSLESSASRRDLANEYSRSGAFRLSSCLTAGARARMLPVKGGLMSQFLDGVDQRTQMVGQNRMELLLFHLGSTQTFGINVFKVREVIAKPQLRQLPGSAAIVCGVANIRGKTVSIIDLARAIGFGAQDMAPDQDAKVIVTEFNRSVQGFWVSNVDRIVNVSWEKVKPPPRGTERESFLVAVTEIDNRWVEIIDVERVFVQVNPSTPEISSELKQQGESQHDVRKVLVVDDSMVARRQIERSVADLGFQVEARSDGRAALDYLEGLDPDTPARDQIALVISDIEMPRMDGYTLTRKIRESERLRTLNVILHSSLSGQFNADLVKRAGANHFLPKFDPDELAAAVLQYTRANVNPEP
jgi:two-component system chemotaxis response regulator CheV